MAKSKGLSESGKLINKLHGKGLSDAAIGRALKRDSSLIGQIRRGAKPGNNLTGSLKALASTGKATEAPRRTTKAGAVAKVRRGSVREQGALVMTAPMKASDETWKRTLKQFQRQKKNVMVSLTFTKWKPYSNSKQHKQSVNIHAHGADPQRIIDNAEAEGKSIEDYLISQAKAVYKPDMAEGFQGLQFIEAGEAE